MTAYHVIIAVLSVVALCGWCMMYSRRSQLDRARSELMRKDREHEKELKSLTVETEYLKREVKRLSAYETFHSQWNTAPDMQEELSDLRCTFQEIASPKLNAGIQEEINKIGWGIVDENGVDYAAKRRNAVEKMQQLISEGKAVKSTNGDPVRPELAACMLDAFNGYANCYILKKSDSYAKRLQMIKTAYYLVNLRGKTTFNLAITKEYLDAQLAILRIQEEISAYRSRKRAYDADMKRLELDTAEIDKRLIELRAKLERAHAKEKAELEAKIAELEKHKRSISNAELTREGVVYVISNVGSFGKNVYKIGMTRRTDPQERVDELGVASVPYPFDVHAFIHTKDAPKLEAELHQIFREQKVNAEAIYGREFYHVSLNDVKKQVQLLGYKNVEWVDEPASNGFMRYATVPATPIAAASERTRGRNDDQYDQLIQNLKTAVSAMDCQDAAKEPAINGTISSESHLIEFLNQHRIKWIDKRSVGGCLWIESTEESDSVLASLVLDGAKFMLGKPKSHFGGNKGWFLAK